MQDRERSGSLLPYEKSTMQAQLNAVASKAFPPETPAPAQAPSISAETFASVQVLHPGGDFSVREEESISTAQPVPVVRPLTHQQILRLLGVSPWAIEYGSALKSWRIPR